MVANIRNLNTNTKPFAGSNGITVSAGSQKETVDKEAKIFLSKVDFRKKLAKEDLQRFKKIKYKGKLLNQSEWQKELGDLVSARKGLNLKQLDTDLRLKGKVEFRDRKKIIDFFSKKYAVSKTDHSKQVIPISAKIANMREKLPSSKFVSPKDKIMEGGETANASISSRSHLGLSKDNSIISAREHSRKNAKAYDKQDSKKPIVSLLNAKKDQEEKANGELSVKAGEENLSTRERSEEGSSKLPMAA